jgi:membrane protein implicated in regulation of membrane protease activity
MTWWLWILVGLVLLVVEVSIPGGIIMVFFGMAALVVGILVAVGLGGPVWFQWLLFSMLSIVSLLTLRGPILTYMRRRSAGEPQVDSLVGEAVLALEDLAPGAEGKVELRGTSWSATNAGGMPAVKGQKCIVERVVGVRLFVRSG